MFTRPDRISDDIRFGGLYTFGDLFVLIAVVVYGVGVLGDMVYPPFRLAYRVYIILFTLFWMLPSPLKPNQKNIITLFDIVKKDRTNYVPDGIYESQESALEEEYDL
ncbi:DUF5592 family protein [Enterococcus hulanensis]|uniref:DUF5592 family protein n=1 Tax=Enterococcus hulanensis TaxID=2559929 RepID=UPI0010F6EB8F|nr:DUF5592 family protein [Enterococcus hulanensis]